MVTLYDFTIWNDSDFPVWNSPKHSFPALTYQKKGDSDFFASQRFQENGVETLKEQIAQYEEKLKFHKLPLVSIIQINRYTPAVGECLRGTFPTMPPGLLEKVVQNGSMSQHVSVIPRARKDQAGFYCLMNLPCVLPATAKSSPDKSNLDHSQVTFLPIATWIVPPAAGMPHQQGKTGIFLLCTSSAIAKLLGSHYCLENRERWSRLEEDPLWIFPDLLHVFGHWGQFWEMTKRNLAEYSHHIHDTSRKVPLIELTRAIHNETTNVLSAREQLRAHMSVITRFLRLQDVIAADSLAERAREYSEDISFHEETSQVILRHLENMNSLAFNIETMTQGEAVARLNVFAFIFLPMSFAASIFGMTNFSISATWYPLWAAVALIIVISGPLVFPVDKLYRYASRPQWLKGKKDGVLQACLMNSSVRTPGFESNSNYQLLVGLDSQGVFAPNQGQPQKGATSQIAADQRLPQDTLLLKKLRFQRRQSSSSTLQSLQFTRSFDSSSVTLQGSSTNSTIWSDGHLGEEKKGVDGDKDEGILQAYMLPSNAVSPPDGPAFKKFDSDFQQNFDVSTDSHQSHLFAAFPVHSKRPRSHATSSDSRVATSKKFQSQPTPPPSALVRVNGLDSESIELGRSTGTPETRIYTTEL